jgi:hypothetical protein
MCYDMAKAGQRILYVPMEQSPAITWMQFTFLHRYTRPELDIPDFNVWRQDPKKISEAHQDNLTTLLEDLQHGPSMLGEITVKQLRTWPEIKQELESGDYDVVAIDYVSQMKVDDAKKERREQIKQVFAEIQEEPWGLM